MTQSLTPTHISKQQLQATLSVLDTLKEIRSILTSNLEVKGSPSKDEIDQDIKSVLNTLDLILDAIINFSETTELSVDDINNSLDLINDSLYSLNDSFVSSNNASNTNYTTTPTLQISPFEIRFTNLSNIRYNITLLKQILKEQGLLPTQSPIPTPKASNDEDNDKKSAKASRKNINSFVKKLSKLTPAALILEFVSALKSAFNPLTKEITGGTILKTLAAGLVIALFTNQGRALLKEAFQSLWNEVIDPGLRSILPDKLLRQPTTEKNPATGKTIETNVSKSDERLHRVLYSQYEDDAYREPIEMKHSNDYLARLRSVDYGDKLAGEHSRLRESSGYNYKGKLITGENVNLRKLAGGDIYYILQQVASKLRKTPSDVKSRYDNASSEKERYEIFQTLLDRVSGAFFDPLVAAEITKRNKKFESAVSALLSSKWNFAIKYGTETEPSVIGWDTHDGSEFAPQRARPSLTFDEQGNMFWNKQPFETVSKTVNSSLMGRDFKGSEQNLQSALASNPKNWSDLEKALSKIGKSKNEIEGIRDKLAQGNFSSEGFKSFKALFDGQPLATRSNSASVNTPSSLSKEGLSVLRKYKSQLVKLDVPENLQGAILTNVIHESGGIPTATNKFSQAYGLHQWLDPRKSALFSFAKVRGMDVSDPQLQIEYACAELFGKAYDNDNKLHYWKKSDGKFVEVTDAVGKANIDKHGGSEFKSMFTRRDDVSKWQDYIPENATFQDLAGLYTSNVARGARLWKDGIQAAVTRGAEYANKQLKTLSDLGFNFSEAAAPDKSSWIYTSGQVKKVHITHSDPSEIIEANGLSPDGITPLSKSKSKKAQAANSTKLASLEALTPTLNISSELPPAIPKPALAIGNVGISTSTWGSHASSSYANSTVPDTTFTSGNAPSYSPTIIVNNTPRVDYNNFE